jgi:hypothetical protein
MIELIVTWEDLEVLHCYLGEEVLLRISIFCVRSPV